MGEESREGERKETKRDKESSGAAGGAPGEESGGERRGERGGGVFGDDSGGLAFAVSSELKQIKTRVHSSQFLSPSAPSDVQRHWSMERDLSGSTSSAWHV